MQINKIIYTIFVCVVLSACHTPKTTTTPATTATKKTVSGYQLQVLNTTDRNEALNAKSLLLSKYPQQKTFLLFQNPYYKVRFGNFVSQSEAINYQKKVKADFTNVFVIPARFQITAKE